MEINKILLGDYEELIKNIPDNSVDLVLTDPPYFYDNKNISTKNNNQNRFSKAFNTIQDGLKIIKANKHINYCFLISECLRILKQPNLLIWCNKYQLKYYISEINKNNLKWEILLWYKSNPLPNNNAYFNDKEYCFFIYQNTKQVYFNDYFFKKTIFNQATGQEHTGHPTTKPLTIIKNLILRHSKENDLILDCFMGSGTTAVACQSLNRKFLGFEINKTYYDICQKKLKNVQTTFSI